MRTKAILTFLFLAFLPVLAGDVIKFDSRQGLPDNSVNCLTEDAQGFIWMGTANGLCRFDGIAFTVFKHQTGETGSICNDNVHKILAVNDGLYVSSDEGVDFYSFHTGKFTHLTPDTRLHDKRVNSLVETDGCVLGTVEDGRLLMMDETRLTLVKNNIQTFSITKAGNTVFAVGNGAVYLLSADGRKILSQLHVDIHGSYNTNAYQSQQTGLIYVGNGIGSKSYVFRISGKRIERVDEPLPDGLMAVTDYQGQMVFGTDGQGITPLEANLSGEAVYSLLTDRQENLWIGTYRTGVNMIRSRPRDFSCIPIDMVTAITRVGDYLYAGLDGGGLYIYHLSTGQHNILTTGNSDLTGNNITSIASDGENLWLAVYNQGLARYHIATGEIHTYSMPESNSVGDLIWTICDDGKGHIWTGGRDVTIFDKQTETFSVIESLKGSLAQAIHCDGNSTFVVSNYGLYKIDGRTGKVVAHYTKDSQPIALIDNKVKQVFADASGIIWVAYKHSGLSRIDEKSQTIRHFDARDGVPAQPVTAIETGPDGRLILSTTNGLYKYEPSPGSFVRIDNDEDLPSFFNYGASYNDGLTYYFGSTKGVVMFRPSTQVRQSYESVSLSSVMLTSGEKFYLDKTYRNSISLTHDQNFFTIHYGVPEYQYPQSVRFSCYMKGLENDWREITDRREVSYTNVPPGRYEFLVRCLAMDGQWTEPTVLHITVSPPWYQTWWARALWLLLALAVGLVVVRVWLHNQHIRHRMELTEVEKEADRRLSDAKTNFYTSITHELRTPVFLITAQLEELLEGARDVVKIPTTYLASIHRHAVRLNDIINRIIDFRKIGAENLELRPRRNDLVAFCHSLTNAYTDMFRQKRIEYELKVPIGELLLDYDPLKLELIISNLMTNAFKYTKEGGRVVFSVEDAADRVIFSVKDNGIGIDERVRDTIFESFFRSERGKRQSQGDGLGLSYVKHLVELHHGEIRVESQIGRGSEFIFYIPKQSVSASPQPTTATIPTRHKANPAVSHTVLIIDDERDTVEVLERSLEKDFRIVKAYDGEEGLKTAIETLPDIILCDMMMPRMDGLAFLRALKKDKKLQHIKIIIFTAETAEEDMLTAFDNGADAYLVKPISLKLLRKRIDRLLQQSDITAPQTTYTKEEQIFLMRCREVIDDNLSNLDFNIDFLADTLAMSHSALYKKLKTMTGMSLIEFINDYKIYKAVQLLRQGETNIEAVAERCGVNDPKNFRTLFKRKMGMTPKQFVQSL